VPCEGILARVKFSLVVVVVVAAAAVAVNESHMLYGGQFVSISEEVTTYSLVTRLTTALSFSLHWLHLLFKGPYLFDSYFFR
jgi:hypothetical protein